MLRIKVETPEAFAHSNWVWKKEIFKLLIDLPFPSKVAFLSLQMPHTRQWWIILQITELLFLLKLSDQLARSSTSTTPCSMTQCTSNREHTIFHSTRAIGQCRSKWSITSPFHLRIQHQSTTTTCCLLKLSTVKFSPNDAVQMKKLTLVGTFGVQNCFHGKDSGLVGCDAL